MRGQQLVGHAVAMGVAGADTDEGAVEMLALSHRDRELVAGTIVRLGYLQQGADITRAREIVVEALRRGDEADFWVGDGATKTREVRVATSAAPITSTKPAASVTATADEAAGLGSIAAHRLLNASAVISMGISTLLSMWDHLPADERKTLLLHMATHAAAVDEGLKLLTLGHDAEAVLAASPYGSAASSRELSA